MYLDELIAVLTALRDEHGNCPVQVANGVKVWEIDDESPALWDEDEDLPGVLLNIIGRGQ